MRKIFLIVVLMLGWVMEAKSQEGLQIAELFNGQYKRKDNAIEVVVKGNQLERYRLKVFRSLTVKNDPKDFERIERLVEQDGKKAISKETGRIGERLYYAFYCFPSEKEHYRYVFFRNSSLRKTESNELTLIYMEGNVTMDELKVMFKK
jgi:hypothetical protein